MKTERRPLIAMLIIAILARSAGGALPSSSANPFHAIVERNVFGLRSMPAEASLSPPSVPLQIILNGITTIAGKKLALLKLEIPTKPFQPAKEEPCILGEGQRDGPVLVLHINMASQRVEVNNSGTIMLLTFEKNGPRPSPPPPPRRPPSHFTLKAIPY